MRTSYSYVHGNLTLCHCSFNLIISKTTFFLEKKVEAFYQGKLFKLAWIAGKRSGETSLIQTDKGEEMIVLIASEWATWLHCWPTCKKLKHETCDVRKNVIDNMSEWGQGPPVLLQNFDQNLWVSLEDKVIKSLFGKRFLVMLLFCGNTCEWKSVWKYV